MEKLKKKIGHPFWIKNDLRKHRYVYVLKNRRNILKNLKYPSLPYPKVIDKEPVKIMKVEQ